MKIKLLLLVASIVFVPLSFVKSQMLYVPGANGSTPGIGVSSTVNIGIGTSSPASWFSSNVLEIKATRPVLKITGTDLSTIQFTNNAVNTTTHLGEFHLNYQFNPTSNELSVLRFGSYPGSDILALRSDGNVGIGTNIPLTKLDINGLVSIGNEGDNSEIHLNAANNKSIIIGVQDDDDQGFFVFSNGSYRFNVNQNGNVGIGLNIANYKLDVNGTIHAREVKVDLTGWSDFVFHPTYRLKTLSEVEQYIKSNGHLENIPSADEVELGGVNVGDMQKKLLEKVEETTLYLIEQAKQIEALKKENKQLKEEGERRLTTQENKDVEMQQLIAEMKREIEALKKN